MGNEGPYFYFPRFSVPSTLLHPCLQHFRLHESHRLSGGHFAPTSDHRHLPPPTFTNSARSVFVVGFHTTRYHAFPTKHSLVDTENASTHLLLALLPTTGMAAIALYIAVYMWKYGSDASIVVQSTVCNGWMFLFLGTLALLGGQVPPEVLYVHTCRAPLSWRLGFCLLALARDFLLALLLVMTVGNDDGGGGYI